MVNFHCPLHTVAVATCVIANSHRSKTKSLSLAEYEGSDSLLLHVHTHTHTQIYIYINEDTWTDTWYRLKSAVEAEMRADKRRQFVNPKFITAAWCLKQRDLLLHLLALFMKWVMARTTFFALPTRTGDDWQQNMRLIWILKVEITPLNLAGVLFWDAE